MDKKRFITLAPGLTVEGDRQSDGVDGRPPEFVHPKEKMPVQR